METKRGSSHHTPSADADGASLTTTGTLETTGPITGTVATLESLIIPENGELTISGDAVTITGSNHSIDTEADASSDNLDTISGGVEGQILIIRAENSGRDVVCIDNSGNL